MKPSARHYDKPNFDWSPDRVALLSKLWAEGLSARQIGARLGISGNAVIGKVHRLGISHRARTPELARIECGKRMGKIAGKSLRFGKTPQSAPKPAPVIRIQPALAERLPLPRPIPQSRPRAMPADLPPPPATPLIEHAALTRDVCHWPTEPDAEHGWRFCGAKRHSASRNDCPHHHALSLEPASRARFLALYARRA